MKQIFELYFSYQKNDPQKFALKVNAIGCTGMQQPKHAPCIDKV